MKYFVTIIIGATTSVEVEADSVEDARNKALESEEAQPRLCWQCSNDVELTEGFETIVYDENNKEVGERA